MARELLSGARMKNALMFTIVSLLGCSTDDVLPRETEADSGAASSDAAAADARAAEGSGLPPQSTISSLSQQERAELCAWTLDTLGGTGHSQWCSECSEDACDEWKVTINELDACVRDLGALGACLPSYTVGELDACTVAKSADLCVWPPECDAKDSCFF